MSVSLASTRVMLYDHLLHDTPPRVTQSQFTRDIQALPLNPSTSSSNTHSLTRFLFFSLESRSIHSCFPLSINPAIFSSPMASTDLKQRIVTPDQDTTTTTNGGTNERSKRDKRMMMAKRGLRSLTVAVSLPLSLSLLSVYLTSSSMNNNEAFGSKKPFWFPPSWVLHLMCPASSFLMGLSAWMVWADGGFHRNPTSLLLYLLQLLFTVLWEPVVFGAGTLRLGLILLSGRFGSMFGCMRVFGKVNPVAGDLIKPCLAWTAFLFLVNLRLLYV